MATIPQQNTAAIPGFAASNVQYPYPYIKPAWTVYTAPAGSGQGGNLPQQGVYLLPNQLGQQAPYTYTYTYDPYIGSIDALKPAYLSREDFTEEEIAKAEQIMEELSA